MSTVILNQQDCFNIDPSAESILSEYYRTVTGDSAFHGVAGPFQAAPGIYYAPCMPNENALGLYETCTSESDWTVGALGYLSATGTPKQTNARVSSTALLPAFDSGIQHLWKPHTHQLVFEEAALPDTGDNFARKSPQTVALPRSLRAQELKARPQRKGGSAGKLSRGLSVRHTPYSDVGSDRTRRSNSPLFAYQCQWFDCTGPCGVQVSASKHAIEQHLHTMHAIQLKADKTPQACHWEVCGKSMRKESIARHILEVHMHDRALCPSCGSTFARTDSMQRHQKRHCHDNRDTPNAHKARI